MSQIHYNLQHDFTIVQHWLNHNMLVLNMKKSCSMVFGTRHGLSHSPELLTNFSDGTPLERGNVFKYLGHWMDPELTFKPHFGYMCKRICICLGSLYRSINCFSFQVRRRIISQLMLPILDYADVVYQNTTDTILKNVNILNNSLCRFVLRCPFRTHHCLMYEALSWLHPKSRHQFHWVLFLFKCIHSNVPLYSKQFLVQCTVHLHILIDIWLHHFFFLQFLRFIKK